jgi:hypothetical protein
MINLNKIYLVTSNNVVTGGVEATYQLYHALKLLGRNVKLLLMDPGVHPQKQPNWLELHKYTFNKSFPKVYNNYILDHNDLVDSIEDHPNNFLLAPEIFPDMLSQFEHIQKGIWWLSVDNGLGEDQNNFITTRNTPDIWHFYQSEYAHWFLISNGVTKMAKLTDYISDEYTKLYGLTDNTEKENIILYNPKKGLNVTQNIINNNKDKTFIPIINMNPSEIKNLMLRSKVYIDFGNHPGKDRIPREASLCGCVVITNFLGSAMFFDDVPIENMYKFNDDLLILNSLFKDIFNNFDKHKLNQSFYTKQIHHQQDKFFLEVKQIF